MSNADIQKLEIQFPLPGATAGPLPSTDQLDSPGFNCIDFHGYGGTNTRMSLAKSPADPNRLACFIDLKAGDSAGHWGGHRAEMWRHPHDLDDGVESWHAWSWWLPDTFQPPAAWLELGQLHSGDGGSPCQSLECLPSGLLNLSIRGGGNFNRDDRDNPVDLGSATRNIPINVLMRVKHGGSGLVQFWLKRGDPPLPSSAPQVDWRGQTNIGGPSWTKVGLYSSGGACQAWLLGFGRAATAARAMALAGWGATTPPPPPPPPPVDSLPVTHTVSADGTTIVLSWTPVAGAGYELWIDGVRQKSFSRDAGKGSWRVGRLPGQHRYEVRAVGYGVSGSVTA